MAQGNQVVEIIGGTDANSIVDIKYIQESNSLLVTKQNGSVFTVNLG